MTLPAWVIPVAAGIGGLAGAAGRRDKRSEQTFGRQETQTRLDPAFELYRNWLLGTYANLTGRPLHMYGLPGYSAPGLAGAPVAPGWSPPVDWRDTGASGPQGRGSSALGFLAKRFPRMRRRMQELGWIPSPGEGGAAVPPGVQPSFSVAGDQTLTPPEAPGFAPPPEFEPGRDPWVAGMMPLFGEGGTVSQFFNPFEAAVISGVQSDFDRQRQELAQRAADIATRSRAFGGSRHAVLEARGLRDLAESEARTLAGLRHTGWGEAVARGLQERDILRAQRQAEIDAARQRFDLAFGWPYQQALQFGGLLGSLPYGSQQFATTMGRGLTKSQEGGGLGGFLTGLLGGGLSAWSLKK